MRNNQERVRLKIRLMPLATLLQVFLPRWFTVYLARLLGIIYFFLAKKRRWLIYENMQHILGSGVTPKEIRRRTLRLFINYSICLTDLLRAPLLQREKLLSMVQFDGEKNFKQVIAKGKGVVLITAHIGNWDLAGVFLSRLGYKLVAVVEPIPQGVTQAMNRYRGIGGMELIPLTEKNSMEQVLEQKKILVLLADRDLTGRGLVLPCFDAKRSFPKGPAAFALKYEVPIILGYFVLNPKKGRPYLGVIEPEFHFQRCGDYKEDVFNLTQLIAQRINKLISEYPCQWFVFKADWIKS
uniref:Lipid A biosynthesis acyltransferase n=1 Tax=candidate division WOR-3 bacterium TaxID=2052148 RepID=A0A7C6A970_UNCW3